MKNKEIEAVMAEARTVIWSHASLDLFNKMADIRDLALSASSSQGLMFRWERDELWIGNLKFAWIENYTDDNWSVDTYEKYNRFCTGIENVPDLRIWAETQAKAFIAKLEGRE